MIMLDLFWLTDVQMTRFPESQGTPRVNDLRSLRGTISVNRNGFKWRDALSTYGHPKTLDNRWKYWRSVAERD